MPKKRKRDNDAESEELHKCHHTCCILYVSDIHLDFTPQGSATEKLAQLHSIRDRRLS